MAWAGSIIIHSHCMAFLTPYNNVSGNTLGTVNDGKSDFFNWNIPTFMQTGPENSQASTDEPLLKFVGFRNGFIPEFESSLMDGLGAITPGPVVIYPTGGSKLPYYNQHEPGHVLQFYLLGPAGYYAFVGVPSILSASLDGDNHDSYFWETSADKLWKLFNKIF